MTIDFVDAVRDEFAPTRFLGTEPFQLRRIEQTDDVILIEFESTAERAPGVFAVRLTVPAEVGDELWMAWDDLTTDVSKWVRLGISVPLLEAYDTTALVSTPDAAGVTWLTVDGRIPSGSAS